MEGLAAEDFAPRPLTMDDLAAMRAAEEVSLHLSKHGSFVRVYVRGRGEPAIFTVRQQRLFADDTMCLDRRVREIRASANAYGYGSSWSWTWSGGWMGGDRVDPPVCFHSLYVSEVWKTIASALRVGDTLRVSWVADNNNGYSNEVGLHVDQVKLVATSAKGRVSAWNLGWSLCQDNSARMVRRNG